MSSSMFSDNSCALCPRHRTPPDLNLHVSSGKTCADIHLELSLSGQNSQKCESGQNSYREFCCQRQHQGFLATEFKVSVGVLTGVVLIFFATRRIFSVKIEGEKPTSDYKKMKDTPLNKKRSKSKQKSQKKKPSDEPAKGGNEFAEEGDESMLAMWNGNNS